MFYKIKRAFERNGGAIAQSAEIDAHLDMLGAYAATLNADTILLRSGELPSVAVIIEELIHTAQYRTGRANGDNWIDMEIEAKRKLITYQKRYGISDAENALTVAQLADLLKMEGVVEL